MTRKCKGNGKAKGYGCGKELEYTEYNNKKTYLAKYGLGLKCCYAPFLYGTDEGKEILSKAVIKVQAPRKKIEEELKEEKAEKKDRYKVTALLKTLKVNCHKYIRERDKGKPCISCGILWHESFQAGHFYKAELFPSIRHNENNINGQCKTCNLRKEGNESQYRVNLPKRIGVKAFDELNNKANQEKKNSFKWDREELKRLNKYYCAKLKELK